MFATLIFCNVAKAYIPHITAREPHLLAVATITDGDVGGCTAGPVDLVVVHRVGALV